MDSAPSAVAHADALNVLNRVFGYPAFRGNQAEIIAHVVAGGDALALMPTGGGKSLCYQIPALLRDGVGVVVSPLIALMEDQVGALARRGVRAALLNSTLTPVESARIEESVRRGEIDLLYVSPERLLTLRCLRLLAVSPLALFAIDEAHCISEWGHDFRPEYLKLSVLHERFPAVPRIALTATAAAATRAEILLRLKLGAARTFASSFDRPNIRYRVVEKRNAHKQLLDFIRAEHAEDTGVVYCQSRGKVEATAAFLDAHGIAALPYHAGLSPSERQENQAWFLRERGVVMVATIAFGMGIDKAEVRFVAHLDVPKSIEGYYQETGRAGRDGLPAEAWMAYSAADAAPLHQMIQRSAAGVAQRRIQVSKLDAMLALAETSDCRRVRLLKYFGEASRACGTCDTCVNQPATFDATDAIRQLLSCVYRLGPHCDATHVIDVLGAGRDRGVEEWRAIVRQCIALGLLAVDHEAGGVLRRTNASGAVLRGDRQITLRKWREPGKARKPNRKARFASDHGPCAEALFRRLCTWRSDVARRLGVPVHLILHDATLVEIAIERPGSRWALRRIPGVGAKKAAAHGEEILRVVEECGAMAALVILP